MPNASVPPCFCCKLLIMTVGLAASAFLLTLFFLIAPGLAQDTGWE